MPSLKALDIVIPTDTRKLLADQIHQKLHYPVKKKKKKAKKKQEKEKISEHVVSKQQMCMLGFSGIGESHGQGWHSFLNGQGWVAPRRLLGFMMKLAVAVAATLGQRWEQLGSVGVLSRCWRASLFFVHLGGSSLPLTVGAVNRGGCLQGWQAGDQD